jgi:hypothetical protein
MYVLLDRSPSAAAGVGYIPRTSMSSFVIPGGLLSGPWLYACGVGHDEDALAEVRRPHVGSRYDTPLRVIPALGQVPENVGKHHSVMDGKEPGYVLNQDPSGLNFANDTGHLGPEPACVGLAEPLAGD